MLLSKFLLLASILLIHALHAAVDIFDLGDELEAGEAFGPNAFRDALADERKSHVQLQKNALISLKLQLFHAQQIGVETANKIKAVGPGAQEDLGGGAGTAAVEPLESSYDTAYHTYRFGKPIPDSNDTKALEQVAKREAASGDALKNLTYFTDLHNRQALKLKDAVLNARSDVLSYLAAGPYCSVQIERGDLKLGACTRASPMKCNKIYAVCQFKLTGGRDIGRWLDCSPQADCKKDLDCEKQRNLRDANFWFVEKQLEEKAEKKRADEKALDKMKERDAVRRKIQRDSEITTRSEMKKVQIRQDRSVEDATLDGNAPLPTQAVMKESRALTKHIVETRIKLEQLDGRFLKLGELKTECKENVVACDAKCPPVIDLSFKSENACTLKCKATLVECVKDFISNVYNGVAATTEAVKKAVTDRHDKLTIQKLTKEKAQKDGERRKQMRSQMLRAR